jgi:radical SAM superfamily enzyme YgiQ (UPF0313 family)
MAASNRFSIDLLLSHGYVLADDPHEREIMMPYPSLGILYLSSYLKERGFGVEIHDSTFSTLAGFRQHLESCRPRVVGLSCNLLTRGNILRMVGWSREAGATVVLGGPEAGPNADEYLARGAHVVVPGEGEQTLEELVQHFKLRGHDDLHQIRGIVFASADGRIHSTPPRPLIKPLSSLPWPDRGGVDFERYLATWKKHHGYSSASLITARGCPFTCAWCSHGVYGRSHRRRSVGEVADEVSWLADRHAPDRLWYADDVFTHHRPWTLRYAEEMGRRGIRLPFECISRADRVNGGIADALAGMGCFRLWIGSESGSQKVLDAMERLTTVEDVQAKTAMLQARGIKVGMFIMLGYEGEDESDLAATVEHLKVANPDLFLTTVAYPIRGTTYYDRVQRRIVSGRPWENRIDRELGISGRRSQAYYHHVTRWMVNEVNLHQNRSSGIAGLVARSRMRLAATRGRLGMALTRRTTETARGKGSENPE